MQPAQPPTSGESTAPDGATAAFARYVEPEIQVLLRVARTLTGSTANAEDLVQETLIRAFRAVDRFDGRHPRSWLLTILRRTHLNLLRRKRPDLVEDWASLGDPRPAFGAHRPPGPEEQVLDAIMDEHLVDALRDLDPRFRTVLLLVDVDELSYAETAEALDIPIGTVMSRLSRARSKVRDHIREATTPRRTP
ncbi:RNA polymerase sigma factor [Nocardioides coralli]|uniref:RNA polymerase sigma factor n=1 Tax=Nocardioides coralli TaxID=2872154 RepID=UPI001CA39550|nr:sigma-70 family RNA polymerase sigma factor [Nocardioides coralli]QZY30125.1 sigma-70 family RNA polymerase sigma factor [Nocardioides coralli]